MDKELKAKWLKALRGRKYKQTHETLREEIKGGVGYCCLGVLLDVSKLGEWDDFCYRIPDDGATDVIEGDLGQGLRKRFGIKSSLETKLIVMNDKEKASFKEIADYIEEKL